MDIAVRELDREEYDALHELLLAHEDEFYPPISEERFGLDADQDPAALTEREVVRANVEAVLDGNRIRVVGAFDGEELVGALVIDLAAELESMNGEMDPCAYIYFVVVAADYRQRGIATAMYRYLVDEILPDAACTYISQRVQEPNTASRRLADRLGFEEFKRLEEQGYTHIYYRRRIAEWVEEMR